MFNIRLLLTTLCASALMASAAQAVTIVQYGTAGSTTSLAPNTIAPEVSGDDLTAGAGINVLSFSTFNFNGWETDNTSFSDAIADDEYFRWGFTVTDGTVQVDLTTLDIRVDRSGTGPDDFEIQASVNGAPGISVLTHDYADATSGVNFLGVDLSAINGLTAGDSVVFTLGAFNAESTAGTFDLETITFPGGSDAIVVSGDISVIPEPSTALLIGLGLAGLGRARRR